MIIPAADLKIALKKLSPVKTEVYLIGPHGLSAQDSDALVVVQTGFDLGDTFTVNKKLASVINRMSGSVELLREDKKLTIKSSKAKIELEIQNVKPVKLPELPSKFLTLNFPEFKKALSIAVASASPAKSAAFGGVVQIQTTPLEIEENFPGGYRIVGTDSIVLTVTTRLEPLSFEIKTLLNLTAASVVQIMDGTILEMGESNTGLVLRAGNVAVYAAKPVQKYPVFDSLLAIPSKIKFGLKPAEWLSAFKTVEPLIEDDVLGLHFENGVVQYKSVVDSKDNAQDEAPYEQLDPDPVFSEPVTVSNLKVRAKYLSAFLNRAGDDATFGLVAKDKPIRLESNGVVVLTMPVVKKEIK